MNIVLVEDEPGQAQWLCNELERALDATVKVVTSESEFRQIVRSIAEVHPQLVIMDVILRWARASPGMIAPPQDVWERGPFRAGIRCCKLLCSANPQVPVILYTHIEKQDLADDLRDLPASVQYIQKETETNALFSAIRAIMKAAAE